jgi:hypothetical protein
MDAAYISALSALAGSVVGGLTSGVTTWMGLRSQRMAASQVTSLTRRQDLFKDFIIAASEAYGDAVMHGEPQVQKLVALYAMISRMRVLCSQEIVKCADEVLQLTVDTYFKPNKTARDLRDLIKDGAGIDPLKLFSTTAREELQAFSAF